MNWKAIRKDFTDPIKCEFCPRHITSGKAIVICNEYNQISFAGPNCGKDPKNIINAEEKIPDLTKGYLQENDYEKSIKNSNTSNTNKSARTEEIKHKIKAYLILRCEKLVHIPQIHFLSSQKLVEIYDYFKKNDDIKNQDINYMKAVMSSENRPLLSYKNLQAVYAADFWLNTLKRTKIDNSFIDSVYDQLHKKLSLSPKQIDVINSLLKGTGKLNPKMFLHI